MASYSCDVLITSNDHDRLMAHLFPGDNDEHGAVLQAGFVRYGPTLRLLVRKIIPARPGKDYVPGKIGYRALSPSFIHEQITQCRDRRLAYLAVHNHNSDRQVRFSRVDIESHERGYPALRDIGRGVPVGALVFGRRSVAADIWLPDGHRRNLGFYRVVGQTIDRFYSTTSNAFEARRSQDRQIRMFGAQGQSILAAAKIAVIGLGGVGSLVAEYLARVGVGHLVLVDPDRIDVTNLSRVVGATKEDVKRRELKTEIAFRHAREGNRSVKIDTIPDDVAMNSVAKKLCNCDFIFLAADSMRARLVVNALAHQYFIPVIQMGSKIRAKDAGSLEEAMCAVRHVRPGMGCLWCNGLIDSVQLAIEAKSDKERKEQAYGVEEPNPSVITLNAVAAAHATNDFLFDFLAIRPPSPQSTYYHHYLLRRKSQTVMPRRDQGCSECGDRFGMGDATQLPTIQI